MSADHAFSSAPGADEKAVLDIVYYTDPLCLWSWRLEPQWRRLRYQYQGAIRWRYRMGGMIRSWQEYSDPLNDVSRPQHMGPLCLEATRATGMPIEHRVWVEDPPASSYPACLAVKAAELQGARAGELYLRRVREALMLEGRNVARREVLLEVGEGLARASGGEFDPSRFEDDLSGNEALQALRLDLQAAGERAIGRFPTMTLHAAGSPPRMLVGYRPFAVLLEALGQAAPLGPARRELDDLAAYEAHWGALLPREAEEAASAAPANGATTGATSW